MEPCALTALYSRIVKKIALVAGEYSADILGASVMRALKAGHGEISFIGIGGERMKAQGLQTEFDGENFSLIGIFEVLPRLPQLLALRKALAGFILRHRPECIIVIDSPDFGLFLARKLSSRSCPLVQLVAPTVWAWRRGRARSFARFFDAILCLFPFEPPLFEAHGGKAFFVGHSLISSLPVEASFAGAPEFRQRLGLGVSTPVLCLLFGSRRKELARLGPIFVETARILSLRIPNLAVVSPSVAGHRREVSEYLASLSDYIPTRNVSEADRHTAMASSNFALAASGTVALELAIFGVPSVIAYKMAGASFFLARRLMHIRYAHLLNIMADRAIVPEYLQSDCRPERLAESVQALLGSAGKRQVSELQEFVSRLFPPGLHAAEETARRIAELVTDWN